MSHIKFYSYNLAIQEATDLRTPSSENAFFPLSNLEDIRSTKTYRTETGTTSATFIIDTITNEDINAFMVMGSVVDGLNASSVLVEANIIEDWTSPPFSETLDMSQKFNLGYKTFPTVDYRFWRITVGNPGGNFVELGNIFLGKAVTLEKNNIDFGWQWTDKDVSKFRRNRYGQKFWDILPYIKELRCQFKLMTKTEYDEIKDMVDTNGRTIPAWVFVDDSGTIATDFQRFWGYMNFKTSSKTKNGAFQLFDMSLSFEGAN